MLIFPLYSKPKLQIMRKGYRFLAALLMALFTTIAASAQTITITGTVHNSTTNEKVPAVSVAVKGTTRGTFTNSDGEFTLTVPKFPVVLVFSSIGYDDQEITVSNASQKIDIAFVPNVTLGQAVVFSASRTQQRYLEAPVTIERLGGATLRNVPAPSYYEAIANLKGVDMHTASLTFRTISTRGFIASGNTKLNQLVDGMDNQAPGLNFAVGNILGLPEPDVDNIEILSGASSALYGSGGMNGTVLITSKNPFKYQGLSFDIKQGVNHIDNQQAKASPFYDWSFRWAKAWKDKIAIKLTSELVKGNDWQAQDYRNKQQIGVLSQVVSGDRNTDPNYNGINTYGDETSANMLSFAQLVQAQTEAGILAGTGNQIDVVSLLNSYFGAIGNPAYPTTAQMAGFYSFAGFPAPVLAALNSPQIKPNIDNLLPFYNGIKNNYFGNSSVSRTGYPEKNLVDYNTYNVKINFGLHWKITPGIEASWDTYFGTGTTVYTGADRYSLRNFKMAQHKIELHSKNWFVRGYTTQENAGESFNATALGGYLNEYWKPSATWFAQYIGTFSEARRLNGSSVPDINLHSAARSAADVGRLMPGTAAFDAAVKQIRNTPIAKGGALFLDKSALYAAEGQLNLSDALHFSKQVEIITGLAFKQWVMNSQGTIFADTTGKLYTHETGAYIQLTKRLFNDGLTLAASGRYDKQKNFKGQFTPRFTAVVRVAKDNNLRFSYQTAYRFPTNQDQYISLITGAGTLIGCLPSFQTYYKLNSTLPGYTPESILAYRASGNPLNTSMLVQGTYSEVKPETVRAFEVGYRGVLGKKVLIDAYWYFSKYQNFLARYGLGQSKSGNPMEVYSPFTTTNISYIQNSPTPVKSNGWGIGLEYKVIKNYIFYGNIFSDVLRDVPAGFVTFFNAPKYRWNLGLRNDNVCHNIGFNIVMKWQDKNYYEGTFVTGTLPSFTTIDAQISYRPANTKTVFRIGATNVTNKYNLTGLGSPAVGGLYYISYGYNLF
jgi:outer membrane receptor protein involved in Fe transport